MTASPPKSQPSISSGIRDHAAGDHARGCMGRQYSCECGYDLATEQILPIAADHIDRLTDRCDAYKGQVKAGSDEIAALRAKVDELTARELMILAHLYKDAPLKVANLCDDVLDQSGGLLGRVRDSARASLVNSQDRA